MLAWILYWIGIALAIGGVIRLFWRPRLHANGLIALGNVGFMGHHLLKDNFGFAVFHLAVALMGLGLWLWVGSREQA